ncbi:hypothetical protein ABG751_05745 [Streptococcus iniae]
MIKLKIGSKKITTVENIPPKNIRHFLKKEIEDLKKVISPKKTIIIMPKLEPERKIPRKIVKVPK